MSFLNQDGSGSTIIDQFNGKPLKSPNNLVVKSDGAIYFTDPPYGLAFSLNGKIIYVYESEERYI